MSIDTPTQGITGIKYCLDCKHPTVTVEGEDKCKWHLNVDQKNIKKPIAKESVKRAKQNAEYNKLAKEFKEGKECQLKLAGCTGKADDIHHQESGAKRSVSLLDTETWSVLCRSCHHLAHSIFSAEELKKMGLKK